MRKSKEALLGAGCGGLAGNNFGGSFAGPFICGVGGPTGWGVSCFGCLLCLSCSIGGRRCV